MYWGKIIGALAGLVLGHSLMGLVAGIVVGHWADLRLGRYFPNAEAQRRREVFLTSVVCLAAKLAKADGPVTRDEVDAFKAQFHFPDDKKSLVAKLFDEAKADPQGFEIHARNLAANFATEPFLLAEIFGALFRIAVVDGPTNPPETAFLETVAGIFGLVYQDATTAPRPPRTRNDPYSVLGVARGASMSEIKAAWRKLTREHHPDTLIAKGVPEDYVALATQRMAAINAAYDEIRSERGEA